MTGLQNALSISRRPPDVQDGAMAMSGSAYYYYFGAV
jgi:hypothetical protein